MFCWSFLASIAKLALREFFYRPASPFGKPLGDAD